MKARLSFHLKSVSDHPFLCVLGMAILHLWITWPGFWSPDTYTQYDMALSGVYTDHHPPMMSWLWNYFNQVLPGSGLLLGLHFVWLYAALFYLIKSLEPHPIRLIFLLFPLIPQIALYASCIWKDVGFAFSFLWCAAYCSDLTLHRRRLSVYGFIAMGLSLFYGTAVKFQAQYVAPVLLLWVSYIFAGYSTRLTRVLPWFLGLMLVFYTALYSVNNYWVPPSQKSHSWQLVKLYDLAAISVESKTDLIPTEFKNGNFSADGLTRELNRCQFNKRVDDLIYSQEALLKTGKTPEAREILYQAWVRGVFSHPWLYLKHRMDNMRSILFSRPGSTYAIDFLARVAPNRPALQDFGFKIFNIIFSGLMAQWSVAILTLVYWGLSLKALHKTAAAIPLLVFNSMELIMLLMLFFCSMAGTARYTYIVACMVHASHAFAYQCYRALIGSKPKSRPVLN